ncbi:MULTISPECIES: sensor histidine kinase [Cohnella]|uniref:sensor histidine kinase n=1 Tax=Cohnella TaxID=329857 RepID=UPI000E376192|nr:sensor histidine kinase [Cohnella sp.]REK66477.1 MAG: histidine kinase [Cohnella sp.]
MEDTVDQIDRVIQNAVKVMEDSKMQVFEIGESARMELESLERELEQVLEETTRVIDTVDRLERDYRLARVRLAEVSRDFVRYTEKDIKSAYEKATNLLLDLMVYREKENYLKKRRGELQSRVRKVERSIERAEAIGSQMNVVLDYLSGDLSQVTRILESSKNRQLIGLKIILAQEEERKRIAREIHDGPAQSLANLVLRTEIAERMLGMQDMEVVRGELIDLKHQLRNDLGEIRKIIFNLRPMTLDDLGLIPTLRKFVQDYEERTSIRTKFDVIGREKRMPSAFEAAMFRLVQEAFNNAYKHAEASLVTLEIVFSEELIRLTIRDNGVGFHVDVAESRARTHSKFGLIGMKERVDLLQGKISFESGVGQGTTITIEVPIQAELRKELGYDGK